MHVGHAFSRYLHCWRCIFMAVYATHAAYATSLVACQAQRRSCCNLYAKLFYKLSKKDGVSRNYTFAHNIHSRNSHTEVRQTSGTSHSSSLSTLTIKNSHRHSHHTIFSFSNTLYVHRVFQWVS